MHVRRLLPVALAVPLVLAAAGTASAFIESTVSVFNADGTPAGETVCEFYIEFNPTPGGETGSYELRAADDSVVASGPYSVTDTEGDREPDAGAWTLDEGRYTLLWDDEEPVDASRLELTIDVDCPEAEPTPTPTPVATQTAGPTPTGTVQPATGTPRITPPPTDAVSGGPSLGGSSAVLVLLAGLSVAALLLAPRRRRA